MRNAVHGSSWYNFLNEACMSMTSLKMDRVPTTVGNEEPYIYIYIYIYIYSLITLTKKKKKKIKLLLFWEKNN
jgi:hypothetical protein